MIEQIADILYDYSKQRKQADRRFSEKVIQIVSKEQELKEYLRKIKFTSIRGKDYEDCPLVYKYWSRELQIDQQKLEQFWSFMRKRLEEENFSEFEMILGTNVFSLHALLHDLEHANQVKKSMLDDTFEQKLLAICLYNEHEFFKENIFSRRLIERHGIYLNPNLYHNLKLQRQLEEQYDREMPTERMANIYATREVNEILSKIGVATKVEDLFCDILIEFYMKAYLDTCISPTEKFLEDVKRLQFFGIEEKLNTDFCHSLEIAKQTSLEERLLLGLPITKEEHQKVKKLGMRALK